MPYFAVHAAKRGRHYWIYIILFIPVVGCTIYFFTHVLPDMQHSSVVEEAEKLFKEIPGTARRSPRYYRKIQEKWIDIAKENLRDVPNEIS